MVKVRKDLTGQRQKDGRLTVIQRTEDYIASDGQKYSQWLCECSCLDHNLVVVRGVDFNNESVRSCGCLRAETARKNGKGCHKTNPVDLSGEYGVGWTLNTNNAFYFDLEDYDKIKDYCWYERTCKNNYSVIVANVPDSQHPITLHHLLGFKGYDHIDRNTLNNRKSNFRLATQKQNSRNRSLPINNTSGVIGVSYDKRHQKWKAYITVDGIRINIGTYTNKEDAIRARLAYANKYFKEFSSQTNLFDQYDILSIEDDDICFTTKPPSNNISGVIGVGWHKRTSKWRARIKVNQQDYNLGSFENKNDAIVARLKAELKYYGAEFAPQRHLFEEYGIKMEEKQTMKDTITFYTIHCPMCKGIQKMMDMKKISYQLIDDVDTVTQKADELKINSAPFAVINGQCYVNEDLKKWVREYKV